MITDVHSHLAYDELARDLDNVIKRAKDAGVKYIITSGTNHETNIKSLELIKKYDIVKATLGIYPTHCLELSNEDFDDELRFIKRSADKILGIGEIGLDYKEDQKEHDKQKQCFVKFLKLAKRLNLPVIIHSRNAEFDAIELLEAEKMRKVVMHCFCGRFNLVKRILNNRWYFSIPPIITFSFHFQKLVKEIPFEYLLTETDAPFLSPIKGKVNEPCNIKYTIKKISEIKSVSEKSAEENIFLNFQKLFLK